MGDSLDVNPGLGVSHVEITSLDFINSPAGQDGLQGIQRPWSTRILGRLFRRQCGRDFQCSGHSRAVLVGSRVPAPATASLRPAILNSKVSHKAAHYGRVLRDLLAINLGHSLFVNLPRPADACCGRRPWNNFPPALPGGQSGQNISCLKRGCFQTRRTCVQN